MKIKNFVFAAMILIMLLTGCSNNENNTRKHDEDVSAEDSIVEDTEEDREIVNLTLPEIEGEPITKIAGTTDSVVIGMTEKEDNYYFFDHSGSFLFSTAATDVRPACYQQYIFVKDKIIDYKGNVIFDVRSSEFRAISFVQMLDEGKIICPKDDDLYVVDLLQGTSNRLNNKKVRLLRSHYMGNGRYIDTHEGLADENVWIYNALSNEEYPLDGDDGGTFRDHFFDDLTYQHKDDNIYYWMDEAVDLGRYCLDLATGKVELQKWKNGLKNMKAASVKYVYLSGNDIFDADTDQSILLDDILESVSDGNTIEVTDVLNKTDDGKYLLHLHDSDEPQTVGYYLLIIDSSGNVVFFLKETGFTRFAKHSDLIFMEDQETKSYHIYDYEGDRVCCIAESDAANVDNKLLLGKGSMVFCGSVCDDVLFVSADDDPLIRVENFEVEDYSRKCNTYFGRKDGCFFGINGNDASLYCLSVK